MDEHTKCLLVVLGFDQDIQEIPNLGEIKQHFRKESLMKHPDKPSGDKESFQNLVDAYHKIIKKINKEEENISDYASNEDETELRKRYFQNFGLYGNWSESISLIFQSK